MCFLSQTVWFIKSIWLQPNTKLTELREKNTLFVFRNTGVNGAGFILQYNEYIVYKTNQIKMKYLAKIKFNHKY